MTNTSLRQSPDPTQLVDLSDSRAWLSYIAIWVGLIVLSASANAAYAGGSALAGLQFGVLYGGYWIQWAIVAPLTYAAISRIGPSSRARQWLGCIAFNAILLTALILSSNLYFHAWNSFVAHTEKFGLVGYSVRFDRNAGLLIGVHIFKYALLILVCLLIRQQRLRRESEEQRMIAELGNQRLARELATARLEALQGQLHPHFLFNALNCIAGLIEIGRNDNAYRAVSDLADLLRRTLDASQHDRVQLNEELDLARSYLRIAELRFGERVSWKVKAAIDTRSIMVPPLMLQPLVENAVKHAVEGCSSNVHIEIQAALDGQELIITVGDNGSGFTNEQAFGGQGIGLRNLQSRLDLLYGPAASIGIGGPNTGGLVMLRIPNQGRRP